jgi:hypothetical protein
VRKIITQTNTQTDIYQCFLGERNLLTLSVLLKQTGAFVMTLTSS